MHHSTSPARTTRNNVGSDILLARHGNAISSLRVDSARGQVVAMLADGTFDTAPNLIDPMLHMPGRVSDDAKVITVAFALTAALTAAVAGVFAHTVLTADPSQMDTLAMILQSYSLAP